MENKILTPEELLEIWKFCTDSVGGTWCIGCPNAVPGSENGNGMWKCKKDLEQATMETLAAVIEAEKKRKEKE